MTAVLEVMFARFNQEFFAGALPPCTLVAVPDAEMGQGPCKNDGEANGPGRRISIRAGLLADTEALRCVLLHEMCHVACWERHGRPTIPCGHDGAFLTELQRLAEAGEQWATQEQERYIPSAWEDHEQLEPSLVQALKDLADDDEANGCPADGWPDRLREVTKLEHGAFERRVSGAGYWYRWHRRQRAEANAYMARRRRADRA